MIVFNMRVPYIRYSASISVIIAVLYYIFQYKSISFEYFTKRYNFIILCGLLFLSCIAYIIPGIYETYDYSYWDGFIVQLFLLLCLIFILPFILNGNKENPFEYVCRIIFFTYALQGFIQFSGYVYEPLGDFLINMKDEWMQERLKDHRFRGLALTGSPFFELPCGMGMAFIIFFKLLISGMQKSKALQIFEYAGFLFVFIGSMLSGRTAFIGLLMGIVMYLFFKSVKRPKISSLIKSVFLFLVLVVAFQLFSYTSFGRKLSDEVFPFAFELKYNYDETGELTSNSTTALNDMYFMPAFKTFMIGDGYYTNKSGGGYYMQVDAGYMRQILFGGIVLFTCLFIYQMLYVYRPMTLAIRQDSNMGFNDFMLFFSLFAFILIANYKGEALGRMQQLQVILLLLGNGFLQQYDWKENE